MTVAKIQKITDHARKIKNESYSRSIWQCKHCKHQFQVYYEDYGNLRAHMRRKHPIEYKPFTIEEEPDNEFDHVSLLRA